MKLHLVVFAFLILTIVFFLVSLYSFVFDVEYNKCDMTYMLQYPEYIPVPLPQSVRRKFPQYNLFIYTEGQSEPVSRSIFEGSPLLFIPGNDGSHKQVRSLASVALQMRKSLGIKTRFDCFAVDLNSEFSALHGPFLFRQSDFVRHAIDQIESLYSNRAKFSIVLVGHSMGGLVARHVMSLEEFDRGRVRLIITLAAPHQKPVLNCDSQMDKFYAEMNDYWRRHKATALGHVTLISIGGGDRDHEVALPLTRIDQGLALARNAMWASASHIKNAWASTDHRCIVWCKQLVIAICKALFSVINSSDPVFIASEFRRRLLPSAPSLALPTIGFDAAGSSDSNSWFYRDLSDQRQRSFRFERDRLAKPVFLRIARPAGSGSLLPEGQSAVFLLDGSRVADDSGWLFACLDDDSSNQPCSKMLRLDLAYGLELPPSGLHRRLARIDWKADLNWLRLAAAFVVAMGPSDDQTELLFELRSSASRNLQPEWSPWPLFATLKSSDNATSDQNNEISLPSGTLYSSFDLSDSHAWSNQFWHGFEATLEATKCRALVGNPGCLAQQAQTNVKDSVGFVHSVQYFNQNASLGLVDCVLTDDGVGGSSCLLHVITNPLCDYRLSVQFRPQAFGAALLRLAGLEVPTWTSLHILSLILSSMAQPSGTSGSLHGNLLANPSLTLLTTAAACLSTVATHSSSADFGNRLSTLIRQVSLACLALPLAVAILLSMAVIVAWLGLLLRAPRSLLARQFQQQQQQQQALFAKNFANFLSPIGCILALYMTQCHCAAAGIAFLLITQLLKTAAIRIDTPSDTVANANSQVAQETRNLANHSVNLAAICSVLTCLTGPSMFVWAKTLQSGQLSLPVSDPHYTLAIAFALIYAIESALSSQFGSGRIYAPVLTVSWPMASGLAILIGSTGSQLHGNYAGHAKLLLLLLGAATLTRCCLLVVRAQLGAKRVKKE